MNAKDRKQVITLHQKLEELKSKVDDIGLELQDLSNAEQEKFDNISDGLKLSEKGQAIEEAANNLQAAADACESGDIMGAIEALSGLDL